MPWLLECAPTASQTEAKMGMIPSTTSSEAERDRRILDAWDEFDLADPEMRSRDLMLQVEMATGASGEEQRAALRRDQLRRQANRVAGQSRASY